MSLLSVTVILFLIMDSVGNIAAFLEMLSPFSAKKQRTIIIREMAIALLVMFAFYFLGDFLLDVLKVSETTVRLASGTILFLVAIKILFPSVTSIRYNLHATGEEPYVVPLAIPLIAGPSLLGTIMLYAHLDALQTTLPFAIIIAWTLSLALLLAGPFLRRALSDNGLMAAERLSAMVLVMLGIQRFLEGIQMFMQQ